MPRSGQKRGGRGRGGGRGASHGRGGSRGGRGGRGRGAGGAGRGRNRNLIPSSMGYVYEPGKHNSYDDDDLEDDFQVFGEFGAVDDPTDNGMIKPRKRKILDHRGLLAQGQDRKAVMAMGSDGSSALPSFTKTIAFTRSSASLRPDTDDMQSEMEESNQDISTAPSPRSIVLVESSEDDEGNISNRMADIEATRSGTSPQDVVLIGSSEEDNTAEDRVIGIQGTEGGSLGFFFDSIPGEVIFADDNRSNAKNPPQSKSDKTKQKQKKQKKKIIRGDDIYLPSDSDDLDSDRILFSKGSKYDDDLAVMQDYIENMQLDEEDTEAMRRFARDVDGNYEDLLDNIESDGDDDDDIRNGAFDHESSDESILELDEDEFKRSLFQALDDVPPSLRVGMRNRIVYEDKQAKKIAKKEKRLEKQAKKNKDKNKSNMPELSVDLRKIDRRIQNFIMDDDITSYQFAPMSKHCRRQVHLIALAYKLKTHSIGTGAQRMPILQKTRNTFLPSDRRNIERFLIQAQNTIDAQSSVLRKHHTGLDLPAKNGKKNKNGKKDKKKAQDDSSLSKPAHNSVVGSGARPLDESNVGHRMLAAMGWKQGDTLGTADGGLTAPIEVVIRKKRTGLGS